jgi:hypothetical protein
VDLERARLLFQKFVQGIADQDAVRKAEEIETARAAVRL